jgi:hypothetical protein
MRRTSLLFLFAVAATAQSSPAPEHIVMSGTATLRSGAIVVFRSILRPAGGSTAGLGEGGIFSDPAGNTVHRYMIDRSSRSYFGYDAVIGVPDAAGAYLVTFQPLSHVERIDDARNLSPMVLPKYPAPQMMHDGETIELDLMVSPDGTRRLTDIITVRLHQPSDARTNAMPREFTLDDGPITFDTTHWTFWKQGQQYQGPSGFTGKPGATLWLALPGQGRYILSLTSHEGLTKSGIVRDNAVSFEDAGQRYELRFGSPIAGAGKVWNLYTLHDLTYVSGAQGVYIGTDRLDNLLPK